MASNAEVTFQNIVGAGDAAALQAIRNLIAARTPESEWLDFKVYDDKGFEQEWSKALCGFATSGGGLLIFGVKTETVDRCDRAVGEVLCYANTVAGRLQANIAGATRPALQNVMITPIIAAAPLGFVVCLIPEGRHKPYRAEQSSKKYYIRAGDRFVEPDPGYLRNLLFPQHLYRLQVTVRIDIHTDQFTREQWLVFWTVIKNVGNVSVSNLVLKLVDAPFFDMGAEAPDGWQILRGYQSDNWEFARPIHPGMEIRGCRNGPQKAIRVLENNELSWSDRPLTFYFRIFANNQPALHGGVTFEPSEVKIGNFKEVQLELLDK